jgi:anaerobic selenocysteine-containing dehydrogenase
MIQEKATYCRICEVTCGLVATVEDGRVTKLRPDPDHVVSRGYSCPKGLAMHEITHDPDRILHPMKRTPTGWQRISWEQAIGEIATKLDAIRAAHGPDAIALYTGNPSGYAYAHRIYSANWAKALGTRNTYGAGSQDNLAVFLAARFLYGASFRVPVPDVDRARHLFIVGTNPLVSQGTLVHMVDAKARLKDVVARGGTVVVIDPRRSETARIASEHHFIRPGTDAFLLLAMVHTIFAEGLEHRAFLEKHTADVDWLRRLLDPFTPECAAAATDIDADTIRRLARQFAASPAACAFGRAVCGPFGTLQAWALDVLNIVTGNLDRPGGAVFSEGLVDLAQTVRQLGLDHYGEHRSRVRDLPGVLGELPAGVLVDEITTPGDGQIRALVVTAGNPVASIANGPALAEAMRGLECTVAIDIYLSETAALADYVLPAATALEREDMPIFHVNLMTEPYSQWTDAVIPKLGEAKEEWEIFTLLGDAMGLSYLANPVAHWLRRALELVGRDFSPRWIIDGMIRTGPMGDRYLPWSKGWNVARLAQHPHGVRLGELRTGIVREKLLTADERIHFRCDDVAREAERLLAEGQAATGDEFPLRLIGRRDNRSNNSWLRNVPKLMRGDRDRRLRIHPDDADRVGVADGEVVRVRSRVGAVHAEVRVTDEIMPGVVSLPHGWSDGVETHRRVVAELGRGPNCNELVDQRVVDPLSGMAWLNGFPVTVEKVSAMERAAS